MYSNSEIGRLRRILIHSPDGGIGKIIPNKAADWLYDDIVDLDKMRMEYDSYVKLLLHFLDPEKLDLLPSSPKNELDRPEFFRPDKEGYFKSDKVIDVQYVLSLLLEKSELRQRLVAEVCGIERCSHRDQEQLLRLSSVELAKTLITGILSDSGRYIFPPLPNLIFTRDIAIVIHDHILITRPAKSARHRETLISRYLAYYFFFPDNMPQSWDKVIEMTEEEDYFLLDPEEKRHATVTIEGGDMMMIAPKHLLVGCSERTSAAAINSLVHQLFHKGVLDKITAIKIPHKRDYMHIDTVFTMIKRNAWVLHGPLSGQARQERSLAYDYVDDLLDMPDYNVEPVTIVQYDRRQPDYKAVYTHDYPKPYCLEDLFTQICRHDFHCHEPMQFVYSGGGKFPYNEREQWTDSCNLLALREGVVVGYDRNKRTAAAFKEVFGTGFSVVHIDELLADFEAGRKHPDMVENTLILLSSAELSRARGGSHCMSMPLLRDNVL